MGNAKGAQSEAVAVGRAISTVTSAVETQWKLSCCHA
jgi:hypothetical protein